MNPLRTTTAFLLIQLTGCGGRTEITGNASAAAAGGAAQESSAKPPSGGSTLTTGGTSSRNTDAGGSQPVRETARFVATGSGHTCALLSDGAIECWGTNDAGQLGDGTLIGRYVASRVLGISNATHVATGFDHTCAVVSNGQVKCWGSNAYGQLGDGSNTSSAVPIAVPGLPRVVGIDVGGLPSHTCALTTSGQVYCWGTRSDRNDLADSERTLPTVVPRIFTATAVSVGIAHNCALLSSGAFSCWGSNYYGQLGNGTTVEVAESVGTEIYAAEDSVALAAGGNNACVITTGLRVQCWGSNSSGQLGTELAQAGAEFVSTTPITVDRIETASRISVGSRHACVTLLNGTVRCWGSNSGGELGDGTTKDNKQPVSTMGITGAIGVAAGGRHTCAIIENGSILCWGSNAFGQLGDGTTNDSTLPVRVVGL